MVIIKNMQNNTMYTIQELHSFICSFSLSIFITSIFSVHSSTNESINFFSTLTIRIIEIFTNITRFLTFAITNTRIKKYPSLHTPLSINSLYSHLHLSSFHRCLLSQIILSNLHIHLQVSFH